MTTQFLEELRAQNIKLVAEIERLKSEQRQPHHHQQPPLLEAAQPHPHTHTHTHSASGPSPSEEDISTLKGLLEAQRKVEGQLRTEIALFKAQQAQQTQDRTQHEPSEAMSDLQRKYERSAVEQEGLKARLKVEEINIAK